MKWFFGFCLIVLGLHTHGAESSYVFESAEQRQLFLQLTQELRCPKCQNQNIADSNAVIAQDLKRKVYELVQQGQNREQVIDFMKARYGDFVHYQPPVTPVTLWLWLLPALFIAVAGAFMLRRKGKDNVAFEQDLVAQADDLLKDK